MMDEDFTNAFLWLDHCHGAAHRLAISWEYTGLDRFQFSLCKMFRYFSENCTKHLDMCLHKAPFKDLVTARYLLNFLMEVKKEMAYSYKDFSFLGNFGNFSFDECSKFDVPTTTEQVLTVTEA